MRSIIQCVCALLLAISVSVRYYRDPGANGPLGFVIACVVLCIIIFINGIRKNR